VLIDGSIAGLLSTAVLAWRGRCDDGDAAPALNAPSHWVWGDRALHEDRLTLRHTVLGQGIHFVSGLWWAAVYAWLQGRRRHRRPATVVADAAAVSAMAAFVDLRCTPERLTPGFERRLSPRSLWLVYGSFALGLTIGGVAALQPRRSRPSRSFPREPARESAMP
jgi:hypothetical protein